MDTANPAKNQPAGFGPGRALRQARLDLRLTPEEVAKQLHLAPRQILALEGDDYDNLPQSTYVRGYLRSYALLLGLSPDPILESYGRMRVTAPPRLGREPNPHAENHEGQVRSATYVVGALVLVLIIAWWQGRDDSSRNPPDGYTQIMPADPANETPPATESAPTPSAPETPPPVVTTPTSPADVPTPTPETPPRAAAPATPHPVPPAALTPATPSANEPRARVVLQAEQESWAEVRDARQNRLLYETVPAGRLVALEGVPPFSVFLGNADGVLVYIDGEAYDARRHKRGTTARFTLTTRGARAAAPTAAPNAASSTAPANAAPPASPPTPSVAPSPAPAVDPAPATPAAPE